jgi:hypothetical protein
MPEKLPAGASGIEETFTRKTTPEFGSQSTYEYSGPTAELEAIEAAAAGGLSANGNVSEMELRVSRGRGTLRVTCARIWEQVDNSDQSVQELSALDVMRSIYVAPYFRTMSLALVASVRKAYENQLTTAEIAVVASADSWGAAGGLPYKLLGHLRLGMDSYNSTAYEFSKTWRTTSTKELKIASSSINTVTTLPTLSGVMLKLVDSLPTGEWLKRPTTVTSAGGGWFNVRSSYLWAPKWSVIYGGTETGLD